MDYCSHTFDFMGIRIGEQLHNGRPYSSSAGCCYYRGAVQDYSGTTCGVENIILNDGIMINNEKKGEKT